MLGVSGTPAICWRGTTIMRSNLTGEDTLFDVAQAAAFLGVPRSWVYSRVESPECDLPHFKIGRYLKFRESELLSYIEKNRSGPRP